jgi:subtilisin family serine protease
MLRKRPQDDLAVNPDPFWFDQGWLFWPLDLTRGGVPGKVAPPLAPPAQAEMPHLLDAAPELRPISAVAALPADPMLAQQWHLTKAGAGINVRPAWLDYAGRGIRVGVIDEGIDARNADLDGNYRADLDWDFVNRDADAAPTRTNEAHGTAVAGVIAAEAGAIGGVGVAWGASLVGYRIGYGSMGGLDQIQGAFARAAASVDVLNCSWGFGGFFGDNFWSSAFASLGQALDVAARHGRGGLGTNIVFAAGNDRAGGQNVNYHDFQNSPHVVTVAATDQNGAIAPFSTPGASILVGAPGSGILTTDRVGTAGYAMGDTASVSGTSFAAPIVSGVIALMLEANPRLGLRDVQEILAYSAARTDAFNATARVNRANDWNGGGLSFNDDSGFGLVDARAAVRLAETWTQLSTVANAVHAVSPVLATPLAIPDLQTVTSQLRVATNPDYEMDRVEIGISLRHGRIGDLVISLVAPSGTESLLVNRPGVTAANPFGSTQTSISMQLDSVQFWGENPSGTWTLKIRDAAGGQTGQLLSWQLDIIGEQGARSETYGYTDAYARLGGTASRSVLRDVDGGQDVINLAAVTGPVALDLRPGSTSTVAGRSLTIAQESLIAHAFAGDGADRLIGNDMANRLAGGRGADTLTGGAGADVFIYQRLADAGDRITDFTAGDGFALADLFRTLGYAGKRPFADGWAALQRDPSGTGLLVDLDGPGSGGAVMLAWLEGYRGAVTDAQLFA